MPSRRYWRVRLVENYGNTFTAKMSVATIDLRVTSGGSNLAVTGNGTASASTQVVGFEADKAFDSNVNTYYQSGDVNSPNVTWLRWDFGAGNSQDINYLAITNGNEAAGSQLIKRWALDFSDNNTDWTPWMYSTSNNSAVGNDTPTAWSWAADMVIEGTLDLTLPMFSFTSNTGGVMRGNLPAPTLAASGNYSAFLTLPMLTLESSSGSIVSLELPQLSLLATGHSRQSALDADLPSMTLEALGGAKLIQSLPALTFEGSATNPITGRLNLSMPMPALEASGTVTMIGSGASSVPMLMLSGRGGGIGTFALPGLMMSGSATVGQTGSVSAILPVLTLEASGETENYGRLGALLPMLERVNAGHMARALPVLTLRATGYAVVTVEYEAWAVNLLPGDRMPNQVTKYTNFPFNQIIRYGDDYYGVADDGLYLLGGDTDYADPTPTAIPWSWKTALTDFGVRQMKVVRQTFLYGRIGPSVTASVTVAEGTERTYAALIERGTQAQAHRIKYGKGLKGVYWKFGLADTQGSAHELDSSMHDAAPTSRKI